MHEGLQRNSSYARKRTKISEVEVGRRVEVKHVWKRSMGAFAVDD